MWRRGKEGARCGVRAEARRREQKRNRHQQLQHLAKTIKIGIVTIVDAVRSSCCGNHPLPLFFLYGYANDSTNLRLPIAALFVSLKFGLC
jgi:hypothetical protein